MSEKQKNTHTPGLWSVERHKYHGFKIEPSIAYGCSLGREEGEYMANARLIAAAPEMLNALRMALPYVEKVASTSPTEPARFARKLRATKDVTVIRAIISKVEGAA